MTAGPGPGSRENEGKLEAGEQTLAWDGRPTSRRGFGDGIYFVVYEAAGRRAVERIAIVR